MYISRVRNTCKRALEVAAAGAHNCLMTGSPGAGKTLTPAGQCRVARSLPSILPRLSLDEALDITRIYSVTGQLPTDTPLVNQRPFRSPHHTISNAGLVGGGRLPRPGETRTWGGRCQPGASWGPFSGRATRIWT